MSLASNGSSTPKNSTRPNFSAHLKEFLGMSQKFVSLYGKEVHNLDQILEEKRNLEERLHIKTQEVQEKDDEIGELETYKDKLLEDFRKKCNTWGAETTKQEDLKKNLAEQMMNNRSILAEADALKQKLRSSEEARQDAEDKLRNTNKSLISKRNELTGALTNLDRLQQEKDNLGLQTLDHAQFAAEFKTFAMRCHELAKKFFFTKLPLNLTEGDLQHCGFMKQAPRSTPISDTVPSQCLRMAAAEKIIAFRLYSSIFQRYYLPSSTAARQAMDEVLTKLSKEKPEEEEAVFRLRLLSAYQGEEPEYLTRMVIDIETDVNKILGPLVAPEIREEFRSNVHRLFEEAIKLWKTAQRSSVMVRVNNEPEGNWGEYTEYDSEVDLTEEQEMYTRAPLSDPDSLFPQVVMGGKVVFPGYALWPDQNAVIAAIFECGEVSSRNPMHKRAGSIGRGGIIQQDGSGRKPSFNGSSASGSRNGQSPTSSKVPQGNKSFAERATAGRK